MINRFMWLVITCGLCVLACTKEMNPSHSTSGASGVSSSGAIPALGPTETDTGGAGTNGDTTAVGGVGGSGVGAGFGGAGDPNTIKVKSTRELLVEILQSLSQESNLSFLGTGLGITPQQGLLVNELIVSTLPQLIALHTGDSKVEILLKPTLPGNVEGRTLIGPDGAIELLYGAVSIKSVPELLMLLIHESFHKVLFRNSYLEDLPALGSFATSGGSGVAINKAAEAIRLYDFNKVYRAKILSRSPLLYARLNETSGTVAQDISGNNRNGRYSGTIRYRVPGAVDGSADSAVEFLVGGTGIIRFTLDSRMMTDTKITVEFWLKGNAGPNQDLLQALQNNVVMQTGTVYFGGSNGVFGFLQPNGWDIQGGYGITAPHLQGWHHFVMVLYRGTSIYPKLYLDGQPPILYPYGGNQPYDSTFNFGDWPGANLPFQGAIDEIAIYNGELPQSSIQEHYTLGVSRNQ